MSFLFTSLVFFGIWLAFLLLSASTRKEQLVMSFVGLAIAPALLLIASTQTDLLEQSTVSVGIEDLIFSFSLFGIAAIIYHVLLGKHTYKLKGTRLRIPHPVVHWFLHLLLVLSIWVFFTLLLIGLFQLSIIQSVTIGTLMIGIYIIADRHDLLTDALLSSLFLTVLIIVVEQLLFLRWYPDAIAHIAPWNTIPYTLISNIPSEEFVWAAVVGFTIGPMYEWLRKFGLK